MAIRTVVTRGYGNGTYDGTIALVVTRGYGIGVALALQIYTASLEAQPSPVASLVANISPAADLEAQPSPTQEVEIG